MRAKPITLSSVAMLVAALFALIIVAYPLLVSAVLSLGAWLSATGPVLIACFTQGC